MIACSGSGKRDLERAEVNSRVWGKWQKIMTDGNDSSRGRSKLSGHGSHPARGQGEGDGEEKEEIEEVVHEMVSIS